ncbi:MAG: phosphonate metabolism transcriptional regulator PhnF, partial [Betaproteobacteria bacterium HGW-Betaproteobacteria-18]
DYNGGPLHDHLLTHYGVLPRRIQSLVTASLPLGDDATLLHMPQHQAVLRVKSVNVHTENDVPVEYSLTRFRADRIQLRVCP